MNFNSEIDKLEPKLFVKKDTENNKQSSSNSTDEKKKLVEQKENKDVIVETMFEQAVIAKVKQDENLQQQVLNTANNFVDKKVKSIEKKADTEYKEENFNNNKDACENYGFGNEKTTPTWAVKFMSWGYNFILAIWIFIGTFTFMPVIFVMKKINVGIKKTWLAILLALIIYFAITLTPFLIAYFKG